MKKKCYSVGGLITDYLKGVANYGNKAIGNPFDTDYNYSTGIGNTFDKFGDIAAPMAIAALTGSPMAGQAIQSIGSSFRKPENNSQIQQMPTGTLNQNIPTFEFGGDITDEELNTFKSGGWIKKATDSIKRRGTKGVCTGSKFGSSSCPPGSRRYNLAKTFKKMAKKELGGVVDKYAQGGTMDTDNLYNTDILNNINEGNTHELNPNEGVPIGSNSLVEQGEYIFTDPDDKSRYVFSNRIGIEKDKSFADVANSMDKKYKNWKYDNTVKKDLVNEMRKLRDTQEKFKMVTQLSSDTKMGYGGKIKYDGTTNPTGYLNQIVSGLNQDKIHDQYMYEINRGLNPLSFSSITNKSTNGNDYLNLPPINVGYNIPEKKYYNSSELDENFYSNIVSDRIYENLNIAPFKKGNWDVTNKSVSSEITNENIKKITPLFNNNGIISEVGTSPEITTPIEEDINPPTNLGSKATYGNIDMTKPIKLTSGWEKNMSIPTNYGVTNTEEGNKPLTADYWKSPAALAQLGLGIGANIYGLATNKENLPTYQRLSPELINLERSREMLRRNAEESRNINQRNLRGISSNSAEYMANIGAANVGINKGLGEGLSQSYLNEELQNAQERARVNAGNADIGMKETEARQMERDARRGQRDAYIQSMISGLGTYAGNIMKDEAQVNLANTMRSSSGYTVKLNPDGTPIVNFDPANPTKTGQGGYIAPKSFYEYIKSKRMSK